ncbi:hypothetical protein [Ralstonia pseudosolanacearum]
MTNSTQPAGDDPEASGQEPIELIFVDTNCFLRLYHSPVHPFLGATIGTYRILTLAALIDEFRASDRLMTEYAWVDKAMKGEDLLRAALQLTDQDASDIDEERALLRGYVNSILEDHCRGKGIPVRSLSGRDLELLATAVVFEATIASDEWPLAFVVDDLMSVEGEYDIGVFTSLDVLRLMETEGRITAEERRDTVLSWLRFGEKLPRDWQTLYVKLFAERPPAL